MKRSTAVPAAVLGLVLLAPFAPTPADAATFTGFQGSFHPVSVSRILDTRTAPNTPIGAGKTLTLKVRGKGGVPTSGAAAVVVNVTAVNPTATSSYLTVYPSDRARTTYSTLSFGKGRTTANTTTLSIGSDGNIKIYNAKGSTDVVVDVAGWYADAASGATATGGTDYLSQPPTRLTDTRDPDAYDGPLPSRYQLTSGVDFGTDADNADVRALAVNITAVGAERGGYLTAWDGVGSPPTASSLSFAASTAVANSAVVKARACGSDCTRSTARVFDIYNGSKGAVDVVVDLVGVYVDTATQDGEALRFRPVTLTRLVDSRSTNKPLTAKQTQTIKAGATATSQTATLVTNVIAISPSAGTHFTIWASGDRPSSSTLNTPAHRTLANGAYADLTESNTFQIYNSGGTTDFAIDVTGKFDFAEYPVSGARSSSRHQASDRTAAPAVVAQAVRAAR